MDASHDTTHPDLSADRSIADISAEAHAGGDVDARIDASADISSGIDDVAPDRDGSGYPSLDSGACVPTVYPAMRSVPALYLVLKNSASMSTTDMQQSMTRWAALKEATALFLGSVANADMRIGVDFFPESGDAGLLCATADYVAPAVPIAALGPLSSQAAAINAALGARTPAGSSPINPALTAALQYAREWFNAQTTPSLPIDVVLVVDGIHTQCTTNNNTMSATEAAAWAAYMATPSVKTHVLSIGANPGEWSTVAAAGGTVQPVVVPQSTGAAIAAGLQTVRQKSGTCGIMLEGVMDLNYVNLELRDADGGLMRLPKTDSAAGCGSANAWYYDHPTQPRSAILCPTPCAAVDAGAAASLLVGCRTVVSPP
jgi:hypothetical protein